MTTKLLKQFIHYLQTELHLTSERTEIVQYGLEMAYSTFGGLVTVLIFSQLAGVLPEACAVLIVVFCIRKFAGGAHCSTPWRCWLFTGLVFTGLGYLATIFLTVVSGYFDWYLLLVAGLAYITVWRLAPVDSPAKPIVSLAYRRQLHQGASYATVLVCVVIYGLYQYYGGVNSVVVAMTLGVLWQCLIMTAAGHSLIQMSENIMTKLQKLILCVQDTIARH